MAYGVIVVGAGVGGYSAAIRLAQLGTRVLLVERDKLGGECLNYGCIPSKALIAVANSVHLLKKLGGIGVRVEGLSVDLRKIQEWKRGVVDRLRGGLEYLCEANGVEVMHGEASLPSPRRVKVRTRGSSETLEAESVVVATGSSPLELREVPFGGRVISSREAVELDSAQRLVIVGGGAVGVELGTAYAKLGFEITIIELMNRILPGTDPDAARLVERSLRRLGVRIHTGSRVTECEDANGGIRLRVATPAGEIVAEADRVLVAVGRVPNSSGLREIGIELDERGHVKTDPLMRTSVPSVYAVGDVKGPPLLAHKAVIEGLVAAEAIAEARIAGIAEPVPEVVYSDPEVASVGLSETEARSLGIQFATYRVPFSAIGKAHVEMEVEGFAKIIAGGDGRLLGAVIAGPSASELIGEVAALLRSRLRIEEMVEVVHPHPTLSEIISEGLRRACGKALHVLSK